MIKDFSIKIGQTWVEIYDNKPYRTFRIVAIAEGFVFVISESGKATGIKIERFKPSLASRRYCLKQ